MNDNGMNEARKLQALVEIANAIRAIAASLTSITATLQRIESKVR